MLAGRHGGQDLPDLFRRPVVGQLAAGLTPPNSTMADLISNSAILLPFIFSAVLTAAPRSSLGCEKMAEFGIDSAIPHPPHLQWDRGTVRWHEAGVANYQFGGIFILEALNRSTSSYRSHTNRAR